MKRLLSFLTTVALCLLGTSCQTNLQSYHEDFPSVTSAHPVYSPKRDQPIRLALVLGAGGARGLAHIGVLEEFENANIPIDLIVGCSAGSIVGALYAKEPSALQIKEKLCKLKRKDFIALNLFTKCHALSFGNGLKNFLMTHLKDTYYEDLKIPLVVVATELTEGKLVAFGSGALAPTVHASCAFPMVLSPVKLYNEVFVDGGVINPNPVEIAKDHNPALIVAVDITAFIPKSLPSNFLGVGKRCTEIGFYHKSKSCVKDADIIITPDLGGVDTFEDSYNEQIYEAGKKAAKLAIPQILEALQKKNEPFKNS